MAAEMLDIEDQERREDLRAGTVAMVTMSALSGRRRDGRAWEPSDFFPRLREPQVKRGWKAARERLLMYLGASNQAFEQGAKVKRPSGKRR